MPKQVNNVRRDFFSHMAFESEVATVLLNEKAWNSKAALHTQRKILS